MSDALEVQKKIGFPVLIKAVSGGGGKGMRQVQSEAEFEKKAQLRKEALQQFDHAVKLNDTDNLATENLQFVKTQLENLQEPAHEHEHQSNEDQNEDEKQQDQDQQDQDVEDRRAPERLRVLADELAHAHRGARDGQGIVHVAGARRAGRGADQVLQALGRHRQREGHPQELVEDLERDEQRPEPRPAQRGAYTDLDAIKDTTVWKGGNSVSNRSNNHGLGKVCC